MHKIAKQSITRKAHGDFGRAFFTEKVFQCSNSMTKILIIISKNGVMSIEFKILFWICFELAYAVFM